MLKGSLTNFLGFSKSRKAYFWKPLHLHLRKGWKSAQLKPVSLFLYNCCFLIFPYLLNLIFQCEKFLIGHLLYCFARAAFICLLLLCGYCYWFIVVAAHVSESYILIFVNTVSKVFFRLFFNKQVFFSRIFGNI